MNSENAAGLIAPAWGKFFLTAFCLFSLFLSRQQERKWLALKAAFKTTTTRRRREDFFWGLFFSTLCDTTTIEKLVLPAETTPEAGFCFF